MKHAQKWIYFIFLGGSIFIMFNSNMHENVEIKKKEMEAKKNWMKP